MPAYRDWLLVVGAYGAIHVSDVASAHGSDPLGWTLSSSPTDPLATTLEPTGQLAAAYLWLCRTSFGDPPCGGLFTAEFGLASSPGGPVILQTIMESGFSNSGTSTCLRISVDGCPEGPVVAASVLILAVPGNICFVPCPLMGGVTCDDPNFYAMAWDGLDVGGGPCTGGFSCRYHGHPFGACCVPDGTCVGVPDECECLALGGEYQGYHTWCNPGACCLPDGTCIEVESDHENCGVCASLGGEYHFFADCDSLDCGTVATDRVSWGRTKALYRP